jgi:hypothetical protein
LITAFTAWCGLFAGVMNQTGKGALLPDWPRRHQHSTTRTL